MLAKQFRLPSSVALQKSRILYDLAFVVKFQQNNVGCNRYGFVVAKSIDKRAAERNRIKRVFRSCIEQRWLRETGKSVGCDVLFVLKSQIKSLTREDMQKRIDSIMEKIS